MHISKKYISIVVVIMFTSQIFITVVILNISKSFRGMPKLKYKIKPKLFSSIINSTKKAHQVCFNSSVEDFSIQKFIELLEKLEVSPIDECQQFLSNFKLIFEVKSHYSSEIFFPKPFYERLRMNLNEELISSLSNQILIHVFNQLTYESSVYNNVRAKRPHPSKPGEIWSYVNKVINETKENCDLCKFNQYTAFDKLGRQETKLTVRMSNAFKIEKWHGLIITKNNHNPLNVSLEEFEALLQDAVQWTNEVEAIDKDFVYPSLAWDVLHKAGVSQIHPHVHVVVSTEHYLGTMEQLRRVANNFYENNNNRHFFQKLVEIYSALGLGVRYGSAVAVSTLVGRGDMEVMILDESPSADLFHLLYFAIQAFHQMNIYCHSMAMAWGPIGKSRAEEIPAVIKIMSRGDCLSQQNDVSSLDLFLTNYRNHDPWDVARSIRRVVRLKQNRSH